ncbi:hypothetical protein ON058_00275 [Demequina sp. B12]|uniref:hypothetical protein n=1 Tax=Demequina sp. B12 TaxID=2992757 RepID=UPI00237BB13C|nr:hypothetical protein [Demequina sp. B12]MDE0571850.1 hypothetical protein [Demequina sp. B12]
MSGAEGYDYRTRTNGEVAIFHHGKLAKLMREQEAQEFLGAVKDGDAQEVMARFVGFDGQAERPGSTGKHPAADALHGNGEAHGHQDFRRKTG